MGDAFNAVLEVPNITTLESIDFVLKEVKLFNTDFDRIKALEILKRSGRANSINIGIKKLLMIIEMARQDVDKMDKFVSAFSDPI